jgi:prepilin-type N-terminal cleavage/methylation domain-containing protein
MEEDNNLKRKGFTLIELIVAMAILFILIYMSFAAFSFVNALSRSSQEREAVVENITLVLDQVTKELRQTVTIDDGIGGVGNYGVQYPSSPSGSDSIRKLTTISMPDPPLASNQYYSFGGYDTQSGDDSLNPILRFYVFDDAGVKHRISYTLGVTTDSSGSYKGIPRQYWTSQEYEPCEILYTNQKWDTATSTWTDPTPQPVTEQVITNFTVIRPSWSDKGKVIQVIIEAIVKNPSGNGTSKLTRIVQIVLRQ